MRRDVAPVGERVDPRLLGRERRAARAGGRCASGRRPSETRPSRCTRRPRSNTPRSTGFSKSEPSAIAWLTRSKSWYSRRPAPIVRWPTSELPIWPGGSPAASPEASSVVCGYSAQSRSNTGVSASSTALPGPGGAQPQPSRMTSATSGKLRGKSWRTIPRRAMRRRRERRRRPAGRRARRRSRA